MSLPTCCAPDSVIRNSALGKEFFVCTKCKQEVFAPPPVYPTPLEIIEVDDFPWVTLSALY